MAMGIHKKLISLVVESQESMACLTDTSIWIGKLSGRAASVSTALAAEKKTVRPALLEAMVTSTACTVARPVLQVVTWRRQELPLSMIVSFARLANIKEIKTCRALRAMPGPSWLMMEWLSRRTITKAIVLIARKDPINRILESQSASNA
jgi:hypothetical protein